MTKLAIKNAPGDTSIDATGDTNTDSVDMASGCPWPEVAEALGPYIKTRQEVDAIRQALQAKLPVSGVDITWPQLPECDQVTGVGGVRKAYLRAVEAHKAAQEKYDALKADMALLSQDTCRLPSDASAEGSGASFLTDTYLPLMKRREKQRKLQVLKKTLANIGTASGDVSTVALEKVAKREAGDMPVPPSTAGSADRELNLDADYDLTRLKKAILSTQSQINEHQKATTLANGIVNGHTNPHAELRALQKAHHELTSWMENQLALISDIDSTKSESSTQNGDHEPNGEQPFTMDDIESLYAQYLEARQRLLATISNPPEERQEPPTSPGLVRRASCTPDTELGQTTSETLLPYLARLVSLRQSERALLAQSGYTRHQLALAETQTAAMLVRLADESHLLQPELHRGAPAGADWRKAGIEASAATTKTATQRINVGRQFAQSAAEALGNIQSMPESINVLLK